MPVVWNHLIQKESHIVESSSVRGGKEHLTCSVRGKGVSDDAQKTSMFLNVAEVDVQKIYFTLAPENES